MSSLLPLNHFRDVFPNKQDVYYYVTFYLYTLKGGSFHISGKLNKLFICYKLNLFEIRKHLRP